MVQSTKVWHWFMLSTLLFLHNCHIKVELEGTSGSHLVQPSRTAHQSTEPENIQNALT